MITAEEFVVKIKADIKQAKKEIGALKDLINGIAEGLSEGFDEASKSAEQVTEETKETAKAKKEVNKEGKETAKSNKQELVSLGKMVLVYKAILKVVQSIAKVFKDGISNAYQMSKVTGGGFSEAMDRMSSKTEAIKNAFGSIAVSFITAVEPIISSILDKLFDFISRASLIIAKMLKLPTYLKANGEIMKQWNKNVEQTRKLLGMDELNIFEKQDTAPENMFEQVAVPESSGFTGIKPIDDIIDWVTRKWNEIKPTIDSIWTSIKGIWDNLSRTFDNFDFSGWEGAFGGFIDIITTTTDTIFKAIKFITGLPSFQLIKPFFEILGHIINIIVNKAAFITTAINDLLRLLSGDLTGAEFVRATNENIKKHLIDPIVNFVSKIVDIVVDTADNIIVAIYNLFHPNKKVEHTRMWYDYQMYKNQKANATTGTGNDSNGKVGGGRVAVGNYDVTMATGGVVNQPTVALIGEYSNARYNPELVTPENVLQSNLDANNQNLISAFAQLTKQIITAIGNVDMSVSISDQVIAQSSARGSEQYYKLTGKSLFV